MPTLPFIKHILVGASEVAANNQAGLDYGGVAKKAESVSFGVFLNRRIDYRPFL